MGPRAPAHWKAEFSQAVQLERVAAEEVDAPISRVNALPIESQEIGGLPRGAVMRAAAAGHPAYDTLFVELALRLETKVASYDVRFQRKFPSIVKSPSVLPARQ